MSDSAKLVAPNPEEMLSLEKKAVDSTEAPQTLQSFVEDVSNMVLSAVKEETKSGLTQRKFDDMFQPLSFENGIKRGGTVGIQLAVTYSSREPEGGFKRFVDALDQLNAEFPFQGSVMIATRLKINDQQHVLLSYPHLKYADYDTFMTRLNDEAELLKAQVAEAIKAGELATKPD